MMPAHVEHTVLPVVFVTEPGGHCLQVLPPSSSWYDPAEHARGAALPPVHLKPAGQRADACAPDDTKIVDPFASVLPACVCVSVSVSVCV